VVFDPTKPETNGDLVSADIRQNWLALQSGMGRVNMVRDSEFLIWAAGDSAAPTHYTLSGASAACARAGVGLGDTTHYESDFAAKVTSGAGAAGLLSQTLIGTTGFKLKMRGQNISLGCALWCSTASSARAGIYDGVGTSWTDFVEDEDVVGSDGFEWLTVTRTLDAAAADRLVLRLEVAQGAIAAVFAHPSVIWGETPPPYPLPSRWGRMLMGPGTQFGNLATGNYINGWRLALPFPALVRWTQITVGTAPVSQAAIADVNKNNVTMYATKPQVAAAATTGGAAPDTTYSTKCFARGDLLSCDQDQVGSGTTGADQTIVIDALVAVAPQDAYLGVSEVG
jgi:hypothetical protein